VRVVAKAAANAIAMAVATAMVAAMATARDGCVGGLAVTATAAGTMTAGDNGQQQHSTPSFCPPGCKVFVLSRFPLISDQTKRTQRRPRYVKRIHRSGTRVGGV
jgi:hypothetical protein